MQAVSAIRACGMGPEEVSIVLPVSLGVGTVAAGSSRLAEAPDSIRDLGWKVLIKTLELLFMDRPIEEWE